MDISLPRENHPDIVSLAGPMSNNLADDGGVRKREMRRARNQRYQERRKQRAKEKQRAEETTDQASDTEKTVFTSDGGLYGFFLLSTPLRIPMNPPDTAWISQVASLNRRLQTWGFRDNPRDYVDNLAQEYQAACMDGASFEAWTAKMEDWIAEGDSLLDAIQAFMCDGYLDLHTPEGLQEIWRRITTVVFKVQYMIAAVEVRLDMPRNI